MYLSIWHYGYSRIWAGFQPCSQNITIPKYKAVESVTCYLQPDYNDIEIIKSERGHNIIPILIFFNVHGLAAILH